MTKPSDTPRTDSLPSTRFVEKGYKQNGDSWGWGDLKRATDLCRELERELAACRRDAERLEWVLSKGYYGEFDKFCWDTHAESPDDWKEKMRLAIDEALASRGEGA